MQMRLLRRKPISAIYEGWGERVYRHRQDFDDGSQAHPGYDEIAAALRASQ